MLATGPIARAVAAAVRDYGWTNVVLDTVMVAKGGSRLLDDETVEVLRRELLPLARLITPNVPEAEALTGLTIRTPHDLERAARALVALGARAALVKGGHLDGPAIDVLFDGESITELRADRLITRHTHGTGCMLSAAIAARLALGDDVIAAARAAKAYVTRAIARAPGLGHGHGPLG
jgi:hydroxymethylpyrimidine/phosphomethylpyrimidine kinase